MSVQLLDRTRKINKLLHNSSSSKVVFNDICQVLMETLSSNILVLSKKGKVLGVSLCPGVEEITELIEDKDWRICRFPVKREISGCPVNKRECKSSDTGI